MIDALRDAIREAIGQLGRTMLAQSAIRDALAGKALTPREFSGRIIQRIYRRLFETIAQEKGLNLPPDFSEPEIDSVIAAIDCRNLTISDLGRVYESLLALEPRIDLATRQFELASATAHQRKASGSYYTPPALVDCLLDCALEPALDAARDPERILALRICDPACGSGHFLLAAARRMAKRSGLPLAQIIRRCIHGVDLDPMAVQLCQMSLWIEAADPTLALADLSKNIQPGNALLGTTPSLLAAGIPADAFEPIEEDDNAICNTYRDRNKAERAGRKPVPIRQMRSQSDHATVLPEDAWCAAFVWPKTKNSPPPITHAILKQIEQDSTQIDSAVKAEITRLARQYRFFHWHLAFPQIFTPERGGFDVILGNPPFVNIIEGGISQRTRAMLRHCHPLLTGTADLAYLFLSQCNTLRRPDGWLGLVEPRAALNSASVKPLREYLTQQRALRALYVPSHARFFPGAVVFICIIAVGPPGNCRVSRSVDPASSNWKTGDIHSQNWWTQALRINADLPHVESADSLTIGDVFEVAASMTAADAYDVAPLIIEAAHDTDRPRLITTGLIDPGESLWGKIPCRYLKKDYHRPIINATVKPTASLAKRIQNARRPKLIVAGLSKNLECFLDAQGQYIGAVSTYSIFHPKDDLEALNNLCQALLKPESSTRFHEELGGNALGGGNITLTRAFLKKFPIHPSAITMIS